MDVQDEYVDGGKLEVTMQNWHLVNKACWLLSYIEMLIMWFKQANKFCENDFIMSLRESSDGQFMTQKHFML